MALILVSLLAAVVLIAAFELAARWWIRYRNEYFVYAPGARILLKLDQEAMPGFPDVSINVNREGERGSELPGDCSSLYRVVVSGGSAAECYFLDQSSSWRGVTQTILRRPENLARLGVAHAHVGNIAKSSIAGEGLKLIFGKVLPQFGKVDTIVIMVGASAVLSWMQQGTPVVPDLGKADVDDCFMRHPDHKFSFSPRYTATAELIRRFMDKRQPVKVREQVGRWLIKARQMRQNARDLRTTTPDPTPVIENFARYFDESLRLAKQKAGRVIVLSQPWFQKEAFTPREEAIFWNGGVGDVITEEVKAFYSHEVIFRLMKMIEDTVLNIAAKHQVEWLNVRLRIEPSMENYYDHFHFTPVGANKVAQMLCDMILEKHGGTSPDQRS